MVLHLLISFHFCSLSIWFAVFSSWLRLLLQRFLNIPSSCRISSSSHGEFCHMSSGNDDLPLSRFFCVLKLLLGYSCLLTADRLFLRHYCMFLSGSYPTYYYSPNVPLYNYFLASVKAGDEMVSLSH